MEVGNQLYVNKKWYMDIINIIDDILLLQIKYKINNNIFYKQIKIKKDLFKENEVINGIIYCTINEKDLKYVIGTLINKLVKEKDINKLFEDAVSMPGLSGTPGIPGATGSGDISRGVTGSSILPSNSFGLEIDRPENKRIRKKIKKIKKKEKKRKPLIKSPVVQLSKIKNENMTDDLEYKTKLFIFLDLPAQNDIDDSLLKSINKERSLFSEISSTRIKNYLNKFYKYNKTLIELDSSKRFKNGIKAFL